MSHNPDWCLTHLHPLASHSPRSNKRSQANRLIKSTRNKKRNGMVKGVAEVHRNDPERPERSHPHPHHPPLPQIVHKNLHPPLLQNLHKNLHPLLPKYLPNRLRRRLLLLLLALRYLLIANRVAKTMRRSIMNKIAALLRNHRILQKALHPLPLPSLLNQQRPEPHLSCRIQLMYSHDPLHKRQTMKCLSTHSQRLRHGSCRLLWS